MAYVAPPYEWGIGVAILVYLAAVANLMHYLERAHPRAWGGVGGPSMNLHRGMGNWFPLMGVIFLGLRYELPRDPNLYRRIWIVRALFLFVSTLVVVGNLLGLLGPR